MMDPENYTRMRHLSVESQSVYGCWTCGAVIFDPERHDRWHKRAQIVSDSTHRHGEPGFYEAMHGASVGQVIDV